MSKIEKLIDLLKDGEWHSTEEMAEKTETTEKNIEELIKTLSEYQLLQYDEINKRAKLNMAWKKLELENRTREEKEGKMALGTIILPNEQTITVQNTKISNLTNEELELEIKMNGKIREIAIKKLD